MSKILSKIGKKKESLERKIDGKKSKIGSALHPMDGSVELKSPKRQFK